MAIKKYSKYKTRVTRQNRENREKYQTMKGGDLAKTIMGNISNALNKNPPDIKTAESLLVTLRSLNTDKQTLTNFIDDANIMIENAKKPKINIVLEPLSEHSNSQQNGGDKHAVESAKLCEGKIIEALAKKPQDINTAKTLFEDLKKLQKDAPKDTQIIDDIINSYKNQLNTPTIQVKRIKSTKRRKIIIKNGENGENVTPLITEEQKQKLEQKAQKLAQKAQPLAQEKQKLAQEEQKLAQEEQKLAQEEQRLAQEEQRAQEKQPLAQEEQTLAQEEQPRAQKAPQEAEKLKEQTKLDLEKNEIMQKVNSYLENYNILESNKLTLINENFANYSLQLTQMKQTTEDKKDIEKDFKLNYIPLITIDYELKNCNIELNTIKEKNKLLETIQTNIIDKLHTVDMFKNASLPVNKIYLFVQSQKQLNDQTVNIFTNKRALLELNKKKFDELILKARQVAEYGYNSRSKMLNAQNTNKKLKNTKNYKSHFSNKNKLINKNTKLLIQNPNHIQKLFNQIQKEKQNKEDNFEKIAYITDFVRNYNELDNIKKELQNELYTKYSAAKTKLQSKFTVDMLSKTSVENSAEQTNLKYTFDNDILILTNEYNMQNKDLEIYIISNKINLLKEINTSINYNLPKLKKQYKYNNLSEYIDKYAKLLDTNVNTLKQLNNNRTDLQGKKQDIINRKKANSIKTQEQKQKQEQKQAQKQVQLPFGPIKVISKNKQNLINKQKKTKNEKNKSLFAQTVKPDQPINSVKGNLAQVKPVQPINLVKKQPVKKQLAQVNPEKPKRSFLRFLSFFKRKSQKQ